MILLDERLVEAISFALMHFLWQGAVIAGLLWIFLRVYNEQGAELRYVVSGAALVLMLLAPIATGVLHHHQVSVPEATGDAQVADLSAHASLPVLSPGSAHAARPEASASAWPLNTWIVSLWFGTVVLLTARLARPQQARLPCGSRRCTCNPAGGPDCAACRAGAGA